MGKKENFTAGRIASFNCPPDKSQALYWDAKTPGLGLRVTPKGTKSYFFETQLHRRTIRVTIGDARTWSIALAQSEASRLRVLTDQGIDPREVAAEKRSKTIAAAAFEKSRSALVGDLWEEYIAYQKDKMQRSNIERGKKWGARHLLDHERLAAKGGEPKIRGKGLTVPGVLRPLLERRVSEMTSEVISDWLRTESVGRQNTTRQGFEAFRAFWRWCATRQGLKEVIEADLLEQKELSDEVPGRRAKGKDCLEKEQLKAWFSEVRKLPPVQSAYLQIVLLTGPRRNEMTHLRWEDIDFMWNSITIKDKTEGQRTIPLTPYVASLLRDLKTINETPPLSHRILNGKKIANDITRWKPSPWVFFSDRAGSGHIEEPRASHNRAVTAAGLPNLSIHGLRRSFATLCEWIEVPEGVVAQIQGHKPSATREKHYKQRPLDLLRMWHTKIEQWLLQTAGITQPLGEHP